MPAALETPGLDAIIERMDRRIADLAAAIQALRTAIARLSRLPPRMPFSVTVSGENWQAGAASGLVRVAEEPAAGDWRRRATSWLAAVTGTAPRRPPAAHLPVGVCGFCASEPMHSARAAACGCAFCYYCLATACLREAAPVCPRCGVAPLAVAAWGVLGPAAARVPGEGLPARGLR
jgi:hypothetical protein